jgi:hypothetical protein
MVHRRLWNPPSRGGSADLTQNPTCNDLFMTLVLNPPIGEGGGWLGSRFCTPPPHQRILLFCLILLNYMTSGVFSGCNLSLLKQHIFLILTQPSWDGYLLLYSPKSSIRGTISNKYKWSEFPIIFRGHCWPGYASKI